MRYSFLQVVFFFLTYCIIGWVLESVYVSIKDRKLTNRGFMRGPFIPIYGCGALVMLMAGMPFLEKPFLVFLIGMVAASLLEYITGVLMEAVFKVRYWDYSNQPLNINGQICLGTSLSWGALSLAENYLIHKPIEYLSSYLPYKVELAITIAVSVYFVVDLTLAFKAAFDLRDLLIKLERAKDEIRLMSKRLDVMVAYANADYEEAKANIQAKTAEIGAKISEIPGNVADKLGQNRLADIIDSFENKLSSVKNIVETSPKERIVSILDDYYEIRTKFKLGLENNTLVKFFTGHGYNRDIIKGNPGMISTRFEDTLDFLKSLVLGDEGKTEEDEIGAPSEDSENEECE